MSSKPEYKHYRRSQVAELADWTPDFDMDGVSISAPDQATGSPKEGDKIARNPLNHEDRWLVSAEYFAANFEPLEPEDPLDDEFFDTYDEEEDSHIVGERRCDYVDPHWPMTESEHRRGEDMELNQCAKCARYFVQDVPLRLFQEMSGGIVLGMVICEKCAPDVVRQMHA